MSDTSSKMNGVLSVVLIGASGYGLYKLPPAKHPYGFAACVIGMVHGIVDIWNLFMGEESQLVNSSCALIEIAPLPLVNIELYLGKGSNNIALGHGLFAVPLLLDMLLDLFRDSDGETREVLKHMTILGNVTSLLYLSVNEESFFLFGMASVAFLTKYGAMFVESHCEGWGETVKVIGQSVFLFMTVKALTGGEAK